MCKHEKLCIVYFAHTFLFSMFMLTRGLKIAPLRCFLCQSRKSLSARQETELFIIYNFVQPGLIVKLYLYSANLIRHESSLNC